MVARLWWLVCVAVTGSSLLLTAAPLAAAEAEEQAAPAAKAEESPAASDVSSVIISLERGKQSFQKYVEGTLTPQLERVGKSFQQNVGRAEELLGQLEKDPTNKELQAAYESTLSLALVEATGFLREFGQLQTPTAEAIAGMSKSIGDAKTAFQGETVSRQKQVEASQRQAEQIRQRLAAVAEQYRQQIVQGKSLPAEIEHDIRLLDADRQAALTMAKVDQMAAAQAQQALGELQAQMDEVQQLRTDLDLAFHQARGQQELLTKVAGLRATRLQRAKMYKQLGDVSKLVAMRKSDVGQISSHINSLLDQIVKRDVSLAGSQPTKRRAVQDQAAVDILKSYLPNSKSEKGPNYVNK